MVYLLGVTVAGLRLGRGPSVLTSVLSVGSFVTSLYRRALISCIRCAVPDHLRCDVADFPHHRDTDGQCAQQTRVSGARERRTALLYAMSRELAATRGTANICRVAVRHVAEVFQSKVVVLLPDAAGRLHFPTDAPSEMALRGADLAVGQWVTDHGARRALAPTPYRRRQPSMCRWETQIGNWECWRYYPKTAVG